MRSQRPWLCVNPLTCKGHTLVNQHAMTGSHRMALLRSSLSKLRLAHPPSTKLELLTTTAEHYVCTYVRAHQCRCRPERCVLRNNADVVNDRHPGIGKHTLCHRELAEARCLAHPARADVDRAVAAVVCEAQRRGLDWDLNQSKPASKASKASKAKLCTLAAPSCRPTAAGKLWTPSHPDPQW